MKGVLCVLIDHSGPLNLSKSIFPHSRISISQLLGLKVHARAPAAFVVRLSHAGRFNNPNEPRENIFKKKIPQNLPNGSDETKRVLKRS